MGLQSNAVLFYGDLLDNSQFVFENYLQSMHQNVERIAAASQCHFYFEAKDIPPFHHFQFHELAAFKYFFWIRTVLNDYRNAKKIFDPHEYEGVLTDYGYKIADNYARFQSTEIWNVETVNSSIRQIEFCYETGMFTSKQQAIKTIEYLLQLAEHIEAEAAAGKKFLTGQFDEQPELNFNLYINEVFLGHNSMLVDNDVQRFVYINHNVINFMITYDKRFCDYTFNSMQNIIARSNLISRVNEKDRSKFFNEIKNRIKEKIHTF